MLNISSPSFWRDFIINHGFGRWIWKLEAFFCLLNNLNIFGKVFIWNLIKSFTCNNLLIRRIKSKKTICSFSANV